jgi:quercetin dioxygenase-like cupin family protein
MTCGHAVGAMALLVGLSTAPAHAQAVAGPEKARPVQGDPGISSMVVMNEGPFRVLRDYAEPGATRRNHNHADATYHVFVLITGQLRLTVEGQPPVDVGPGEALSLKGGVMHTFTNTGKVTATIVEVFGKAPAAAADLAAAEALARALAPPPPGPAS